MIVSIVADTTQRVLRAAPEQPIGIYLSIAALALTVGGMLLKGGILIGEWNAHRRTTSEALNDLYAKVDAADISSISREELNARFDTVNARLESVTNRLGDLARLLTEAMKTR